MASFGLFLSLTADPAWQAKSSLGGEKNQTISLTLYKSNGFAVSVTNKTTGETNVTKLDKVEVCNGIGAYFVISFVPFVYFGISACSFF
jgi:hypothetical protein